MTDTIAINITKIEQVRELPKCELRCYSLSDGWTIERAIEMYENYYHRSPERGWQWGNYLYLEAPAKDGGADE
jgi:hypothetical protein